MADIIYSWLFWTSLDEHVFNCKAPILFPQSSSCCCEIQLIQWLILNSCLFPEFLVLLLKLYHFPTTLIHPGWKKEIGFMDLSNLYQFVTRWAKYS